MPPQITQNHVFGNAPPIERENAKPCFGATLTLHCFHLIFKVSLRSKITRFRKRAVGNRTQKCMKKHFEN